MKWWKINRQSRTFDSQTMKPTGGLNCRTQTGNDSSSGGIGDINKNPAISDYFRSSTNKGIDKEANRLIM